MVITKYKYNLFDCSLGNEGIKHLIKSKWSYLVILTICMIWNNIVYNCIEVDAYITLIEV